MPEIIEISGLDDMGQESEKPGDTATALIAVAVLGGVVLVLGVLLPMLLAKKKDEGLGDLGVIKPCRVKDRDPKRPKKDQMWCLWDSKGKKIIGRHPSWERALRQERLIQVRKHG